MHLSLEKPFVLLLQWGTSAVTQCPGGVSAVHAIVRTLFPQARTRKNWLSVSITQFVLLELRGQTAQPPPPST